MERVIMIIIPIFGMAILGFVSGKIGILGERASDGLGEFVFKLALPIMLFHKLAILEIPQLEWRGMFAYYAAASLMLLGTATFSRKVLGLGVDQAGSLGMGTAFSNTVLLGLPIVMKVHGEEGTLLLLLIISCHTTLLFAVGTIYVEAGKAKGQGNTIIRSSLLGLVRNPIILGLISGGLYNFSDLPMPSWLDEIGSMFGACAVPCALFAAGLSLSRFHLGGHLSHAALVVVLKLIAHPVLMWLLATYIFQLSDLWRSVTVIAAAMPSGINAYLFATGYKAKEASVAAAILASTGLGMVTTSIILFLEI